MSAMLEIHGQEVWELARLEKSHGYPLCFERLTQTDFSPCYAGWLVLWRGFTSPGSGKIRVMDLKVVILILCYAFIGCFVQDSQQLQPSYHFEKTRLRFASKTPYQKRNITFEAPKNCEPLHISMVLRHGTRYPSRKDVGKIDKMLKVVNEAFHSSTQRRIGDLWFPWKNPFSRSHDKLLAPDRKSVV